MGLSTDGTKGHGTGRKALNNISHRFNLIKRDGAARVELELELTTEGHLLVLFIDDFGKLLVSIAGVGTSSDLQIHHRTWSVQVSLATLAVVVLTIAGNKRNGILAVLGVGAVVESVKVTVQGLKVRALDTSGSSGEATVDNLISESNSLEDLWSKKWIESKSAR